MFGSPRCGPLLGEREHEPDLAAQDRLGVLAGLPAGFDACGAGAVGAGLPGAAEVVDPAFQAVGPGLRPAGALVQLTDVAAQAGSVRVLPPGRAGVDAQLAVALGAGDGETLPDARQPFTGGVAPGDAAFQSAGHLHEVLAVFVAAPLQADDLPVRPSHGTLRAVLAGADGGHAAPAVAGLDARREDAVHRDEQQERQRGDQQPRGRRDGDVVGRGSEHATDARDDRCAPAPPGGRTPPGPSRRRTRHDERRHAAPRRRCSIGA